MGKFKVSVIITTYNRPELLSKRSLPSVLSQSYDNFECLIVNDGSGVSYDIDLSDKRIRYVLLPENKGAAYAREYGVSLAKGEYVVLLDDDNELHTDFLKETVSLLDGSDPRYGGVQVGRMIDYGSFQDYAPPYYGTFYASIDWGWLLKKEVFKFIKYDTKMYGDEDADLGIQFSHYFEALKIDKPLQTAYDSEESMCLPTERRLKGLEHFIKKNMRYYRDPNERRYLYRLAGRNFYRGGHKLRGISYFYKSFKVQKSWKTFKHLFFILLGWKAYDAFMTREEKTLSAKRRMLYGY